MKNALATATANQTPKTTSLPASAKALLADTFSLGDEPGKWEPPALSMMPARRELEAWVSTLKAQLEPASDTHIGYLVRLMANSMAMRNGATQQMASRTDAWLLACEALPADLWTDGCTELLRTKTFMPSPGELMAIVGRKFEERRRMLQRATLLLGDKPVEDKAKPFVPESRTVRLRAMRDGYRKHGHEHRAAKFEIELAQVEGRSPEDWALAAEAGIPTADGEVKRDTPPTRPPSPAVRAGLDIALAQAHRAAGRIAYAERLERRAGVTTEPPPHDGVPEAMEYGT